MRFGRLRSPAMCRLRLPESELCLWPLRRRSITPAAGLMSAGPRSTTGRRCVGPVLHRHRRVYLRRPRSSTGAAAPPSRRARSSACSAVCNSVGSGPPPAPSLLRPAAGSQPCSSLPGRATGWRHPSWSRAPRAVGPDATTVPRSAACSAPGLSAQANMLRPAVSELSGLASPNSLDVAA